MRIIGDNKLFQPIPSPVNNTIPVSAAFDIEATNDSNTRAAYMYVWQLYLNGTVYIGRTWEEFFELLDDIAYYFKSARVDEIQQFKYKMEACYGMPAGEWCKNVYEYTCKRYEAVFKDFKEYAHSINY